MAGALMWPSSSSQPVIASKGRNHAFTVLTAPIHRTALRTCLATSSLTQRSGAFYSGRRAKSADVTTRLAAHEESEVAKSGGTVEVEAAYEVCRAMTAEYAKTFYFATTFQPRQKARSIYAIYAWCRALDESIDSAAAHSTAEDLEAALSRVETNLSRMWRGDSGGDSAPDIALLDTITRTPGMAVQPFQDMVRGMRMDVRPEVRYATFDDLYLYCYRVAGTVGLMTIPVLGTAPGVTVEEAAGPGVALGVALQLTNILRDVGEDARRGRIYLPVDDLRRFGVSEAAVLRGEVSREYRLLIEFQIQRALAYYARAEGGVASLAPSARVPVLAALALYRRILLRLRENGYDNFTRRAFTGKAEKVGALPGVVWQVASGGRGGRGARDASFWLDLPEPRRSCINTLLAAVALEDSDAVEAAAAALAEHNPTPSPTASALLAGEWELLWSSPGSDYSRLRAKLQRSPLPVAPRSLQLIGDGSSQNIVKLGALRVVIDATISFDADDPTGRTTLVGPPYQFKLSLGGVQAPLRFPPEFGQERTCVEQLYVDPWLKVSRVGAFGERTTAGSLFIHLRDAPPGDQR